jgi:LacI family transcriptional regulator
MPGARLAGEAFAISRAIRRPELGRCTIHDVAAAAEVSIKTVSRVLNDEPSVRPETRRRVQEAMASLNYQPSLPARSLAGRRSSLIALLFQNPSPNYVFAVQSGAMAKCRETHLRLLVQSGDDLEGKLVDEVLAMVEQTHIDGVVITPPLSANAELIAALESRGLPFVRVAPDGTGHSSPVVEMDDEAAAREMTSYLLALGHRRIGFINGHPGHHSSRLRLQGFEAALREWGIDPAEQPSEQGYNSFESGLAAARRLLASTGRPTAIFASNDDMAAGTIFAAHEFGIKVPDQLSVSGFDDTQLASTIYPPLTTVHQPSYDMAYAATALLIDLVRGRDVPRSTQLGYNLVKRGSTAPPPQAV